MLTRTEVIGLIKQASMYNQAVMRKQAIWNKALDAIRGAMSSGQNQRAHELASRLWGKVSGAADVYSNGTTAKNPAKLQAAASRLSGMLYKKKSILGEMLGELGNLPGVDMSYSSKANVLASRARAAAMDVARNTLSKHVTKAGVGAVSSLIDKLKI